MRWDSASSPLRTTRPDYSRPRRSHPALCTQSLRRSALWLALKTEFRDADGARLPALALRLLLAPTAEEQLPASPGEADDSSAKKTEVASLCSKEQLVAATPSRQKELSETGPAEGSSAGSTPEKAKREQGAPDCSVGDAALARLAMLLGGAVARQPSATADEAQPLLAGARSPDAAPAPEAATVPSSPADQKEPPQAAAPAELVAAGSGSKKALPAATIGGAEEAGDAALVTTLPRLLLSSEADRALERRMLGLTRGAGLSSSFAAAEASRTLNYFIISVVISIFFMCEVAA